MNPAIQLTPAQAFDFLLHVAVVRPVFLWGVPKIGGDCSRFFPTANIVRREAFVLFLDELNASSHEIQKAFYSLILDRRVSEYHLPAGTIVIGAGNRAKDAAIVKPMPSALVNRLAHIHLRADHRQWLDWAMDGGGIHPWVLDYIRLHPDHLWSEPPKHEEPFSTPRSWHMLSDALHSFSENLADEMLEALAFGLLSPAHAGQFKGFVKQVRQKYALNAILKGDAHWPAEPADRDLLYFLAQSFRGTLRKELPEEYEVQMGLVRLPATKLPFGNPLA